MFGDYLEELQEGDRKALQAVIHEVRKLAPEAEEGRSYGLPAFRYRGKPLLGFSAAKKHLSVYPFSPAVIVAVQTKLDGFAVSKGTVRFTASNPLPEDVVRLMVRARMVEIEG
jgi:uncharacterized protein YdhG (YjbR/CyaY superfamily)